MDLTHTVGMRVVALGVVLAVAMAGPAQADSRADQTPGCVDVSEYNRVAVDAPFNTKAQIDGYLGDRGHRVLNFPRPRVRTAVRFMYAGCSGTMFVTYERHVGEDFTFRTWVRMEYLDD